MNYAKLLAIVEQYVLTYFKNNENELPFHNQKHTQKVVNYAKKLIRYYKLDEKHAFIVLSACWFVDIGYVSGVVDSKQQSADLALNFLRSCDTDVSVPEAVKCCIVSACSPNETQNITEQIVHDANMYYLGSKNFNTIENRLWEENQRLQTRIGKRLDWRQQWLNYLENQFFFTERAQNCFQAQRNTNLKKLRKQIQKMEKRTGELDQPVSTVNKKEKRRGTSDKPDDSKERPEKGIETMFKICSGNHQRLSDMADRKAHIMITVNSIILSAIISLVIRRLDAYAFLILPSFLLLFISVMAMTFSILSTRPTIPHGVFSQEAIDNKTVNLLFFGNFYKMGIDQYTTGMQRMMKDNNFLYGSLIKDIHAQGIILGKKYQLLRVSYSIFMYGLITTVVVFVLAFILKDSLFV